MRLFILILFISGCGPDLCSEEKWKIAKLQREADMWESVSKDWQQNYYDKDCSCSSFNQDYYHAPETAYF
jgi:hypothetical protein